MPAPRPPSADPLVALADQCVRCGLCLPACPTYRRDGLEPESPRGRIAITRAWALEAITPTDAGDAHLDHCLGCRACEAACPAGVRFGDLLVQARGRQRARRPARRIQRLVEALAARPRWLAGLLALYRVATSAWPARGWPVAAPPGRHPRDPLYAGARQPSGTRSRPGAADGKAASHAGALPPPAPGPSDGSTAPASSRPVVALFVGCAARAYESPVRAGLVRLLAAAGIDVAVPGQQTCCGSLHAHAGAIATASTLARRNAAAFAEYATVVTLASGCHECVGASLATGARAVDALALLADRIDALAFRPSGEHVALHLPCTQRNVVGSAPALRRLIAAVPGTRITTLDAGFGCCGAAGTQFLVEPARAATYREPLMALLHASSAQRLLSANIGCRLHLQGGTAVAVEHPVEFLARHLADTPAERPARLDSPA